MNFVDAVKKCFRDYLTFQGRAPRSEYWWFVLFTSAVMSLLAIGEWGFSESAPGAASLIHALFVIFWIATLLPSLSVGVRRLHDTDRAGWWILLGLPLIISDVVTMMSHSGAPDDLDSTAGGFSTPLIILGFACILLLLYFLIRKGTDGDNRFGSNPLGGGDG